MIAEPATLDPMATTADLTATIMQHVYEPLYTFDANWKMIPMLAESLPKVSADGKRYSITLRKGVMLHNGRELNSEDVVLSLKRWMEVSPRGKALAKEIESLTASGANGVEIVLKAPYAPLAAAAGTALRHGRHHGQGVDRHAAERIHRHRPLQVQGAPPRPVRAADQVRPVLGPQGSRQRLRRQEGRDCRRAALHPRAQRQHARRRLAGRPVPLCRPAAHRSARAPGKIRRQDRAHPHAVFRLSVLRVQHQGRRDGLAAAAQGRADQLW
jgi:hypothetical protein